MNKIFFILAIALTLSACGEESETSNLFDLQYSSSPTCDVSQQNKTIIINKDGAGFSCKVNVPDLIDGRTFKLQCTSIDTVIITAQSNSDAREIDNAIATNSPYRFSCNNGREFLTKEQCLAAATTRLEEFKCTQLDILRN